MSAAVTPRESAEVVIAITSLHQLSFVVPRKGISVKHPLSSILGLACAASLLCAPVSAATVQVLPRANVAGTPTYAYTYTESPAWADSFADSVGVDSKFGNHTYGPLVTTWLEWSGIRHLRDSSAASALMIGLYANLGQHGIKHSIGVPSGFDPAKLTALLAAFAPYVDYVEGPNESDNVPNPNWAQLNIDQQNIWNTVRGNPANNNIAVFGLSFDNPSNGIYLKPMDTVENFATLHNATCDWNPGTSITPGSIAMNTTKIRLSSAYKPIVTTETGYSDNTKRGCALSDQIIAKYEPRTSAERWLAGEPRSYFDFLIDDPTDATFGKMGLLKINGTPKPQMISLGNLIRAVADPGRPPAPQVVTYTVTGASVDVHHIMLARQDGSYDLLLWRELPCWDHFGHDAIVVPPLPVTVTILSKSQAILNQYNSSWSLVRSVLPISQSTHTTATFNVTDSISVLHIYGR
jgi:hypothetical protein